MRPKLRPVQVGLDHQEGQSLLILSDPLGLSKNAVAVSTDIAPLLNLCDGTRDIAALQSALELHSGIRLDRDYLDKLFAALDEALLLDSERFIREYQAAVVQFRCAPSRPSVMIGSAYFDNPVWMERMFDEYCISSPPPQDGMCKIRGLVSPHIDYQRGGPTYARVWQRAADSVRSADVAIILGTNHMSSEKLITLTRQSYSTPWGVLHTADDIVNSLAEALGEKKAFSCELNHRNEHSVEAAAVWLHYMTRDNEFPLVPILCGSLQRFIEGNESPGDDEDISCFVDAIRRATSGRRTLIVAAGDLAHVGPAFGDAGTIDPLKREKLTSADNEFMDLIANGDAEGMFRLVRQEKDRRRICGLSPIYLMLRLLGATRGEITSYAQCPADAQSNSFVSICGIVLS